MSGLADALPLYPAQAGIQMGSTDVGLNPLGPRFRGDERTKIIAHASLL